MDIFAAVYFCEHAVHCSCIVQFCKLMQTVLCKNNVQYVFMDIFVAIFFVQIFFLAKIAKINGFQKKNVLQYYIDSFEKKKITQRFCFI